MDADITSGTSPGATAPHSYIDLAAHAAALLDSSPLFQMAAQVRAELNRVGHGTKVASAYLVALKAAAFQPWLRELPDRTVHRFVDGLWKLEEWARTTGEVADMFACDAPGNPDDVDQTLRRLSHPLTTLRLHLDGHSAPVEMPDIADDTGPAADGTYARAAADLADLEHTLAALDREFRSFRRPLRARLLHTVHGLEPQPDEPTMLHMVELNGTRLTLPIVWEGISVGGRLLVACQPWETAVYATCVPHRQVPAGVTQPDVIDLIRTVVAANSDGTPGYDRRLDAAAVCDTTFALLR